MNLNFYTLSVIYLVYSFLGWVGETVVATIKGRQFTNRGMASGPFCFVYGTAGGSCWQWVWPTCAPIGWRCSRAASSSRRWWGVTAKFLERVHHRRWWDYSGKKFNLDGYVCLQYSVLWGVLGAVSVRWGNDLLLRLCAVFPPLLFHIAVWVSMSIAALDQIGAAVVVERYAAKHPRLEQLGQGAGQGEEPPPAEDRGQRGAPHPESLPRSGPPEPTTTAEKAMSFSDLVWLFVVGSLPRRRGGNHFLPGHGGGLDEPVQPCVGPLQRGVGGWRWCWPPSCCEAASARARAASSGLASSSAARMSMCAAPSLSCCSAPCSGITAASSSTLAAASTCCTAFLGHRGRGMDPVWLPAGGQGDEQTEDSHPPMDDGGTGRLHGGEHGVSTLALARYDARTSGVEAATPLAVFLDAHFDNARGWSASIPTPKKWRKPSKNLLPTCRKPPPRPTPPAGHGPARDVRGLLLLTVPALLKGRLSAGRAS